MDQLSPGGATSFQYSIKTVLKRRNRIREGLRPCYLDHSVVGSKFDQFVFDVKKLLPAGVTYDNLYDSLRHLAGEKLTEPVLRDMAWRLAGNIPRLKRDGLHGSWTSQPFAEWVPSQITGMARIPGRKPMYSLKFQVLAGLCCPAVIMQRWSGGFCRVLANVLGFNRRPPAREGIWLRQFKHPTELVTLRLMLLIEPKHCGRLPGFERISASPALMAWNREQLKYRDRREKGYGCPKKQPLDLPCYQCPVGFASCRAGTHENNYSVGLCPNCGGQYQMFDPKLPAHMCVDCHIRQSALRPY
jgi:hypothetical protein